MTQMLRARWLGRVPYREAEALQRAIHERCDDQYLLLQEHPHVYTLGSRADAAHVLRDPASVGAELVVADRGGDVTYHGPGQLVGYPIVSLAAWRAGQRDVVAYVRKLESVLIAALADFGIEANAVPGFTGVWVGDRKIAAIGVRVARGRTRHGFALNVNTDLSMFEHIVPCGIRDRGVTSMAREIGHSIDMRRVVDRIVARFAELFEATEIDRQDVAWRISVQDVAPFTRGAARDVPVRLLGRLAAAGVESAVDPAGRRPEWMKVRAHFDEQYLGLKRLVRDLELHTVCEEAGCPNIYECWADRTATFMILGDRCTRACGFCMVDTRKPLVVDDDEPRRVADAVVALGLAHVVITCVARDDLPDGGAAIFAATVEAVRAASTSTAVELLISDMKGDAASLAAVFAARPDVLNHNLETVARLQRAVRPSAGYARSLSVLARAKHAGLVTKSGLILGMGETAEEVMAALRDLRAVGVDLVTIGQYLRPSAQHLPVARWWTPDEFDAFGAAARAMGFAHVEAGPLVRSSYHARRGIDQLARASG
ncbi:MAG TPA: lipoyl synthase [Acidimicrobiia bacterium]|nr:lipoyl synthase [Acidimicrobiia bacterium]